MNKTITDLIQIDNSLVTPVYKQIVQSIRRNIENGILGKGDVLPSVNKIAEKFSLARGSVFTAYNDLRASGIIDSIPGKGYFISSTETKQQKRIFLLLNTFSPYREILFNALLHSLPESCTLDVYFHQHDMKLFENLVRNEAGHYNVFIIVPEVNNNTLNILSLLDPKKTFLLDTGYKEFKNNYPGVYQHAEKDIYSLLITHHQLVSKYKRLYFVTADENSTKNIIAGFNKFCKKTALTTGIKKNIEAGEIKKGDGYIIFDDKNLIEIVKIAKEKQWQLGQDLGVISYHESALKSIIGEGITTITTDLEAMGKTMASLIQNGKPTVVENPFVMTDRKSF
ncbi:MAG: GntR family transcriptional regulator [Ferruginibacter sp.]